MTDLLESASPALEAQVVANRLRPCRGDWGRLWVSHDPAERARAADMCPVCPVLEECAVLRDKLKPTAGVWAGVDCEEPEVDGPPCEVCGQAIALRPGWRSRRFCGRACLGRRVGQYDGQIHSNLKRVEATAERLEKVERLMGDGTELRQVAEAVEMTPGSLARFLWKRGRPELARPFEQLRKEDLRRRKSDSSTVTRPDDLTGLAFDWGASRS